MNHQMRHQLHQAVAEYSGTKFSAHHLMFLLGTSWGKGNDNRWTELGEEIQALVDGDQIKPAGYDDEGFQLYEVVGADFIAMKALFIERHYRFRGEKTITLTDHEFDVLAEFLDDLDEFQINGFLSRIDPIDRTAFLSAVTRIREQK